MNAEHDSLTKVGHLEFSQVADEQVLGLQVPVEDPPAMDVAESSQQLEHEDLQQHKKLKSNREWTLEEIFDSVMENRPGRCVSADLQGAGSCTGLGLFAAATEEESPEWTHEDRVLIQIQTVTEPVPHHIFKDKGQRVPGVDDVMEDHDVGVFETFEQRG